MITLLLNIAHNLFGHKWSQWQTFLRAEDADFGFPVTYQRRVCEVCGKEKQRCEWWPL